MNQLEQLHQLQATQKQPFLHNVQDWRRLQPNQKSKGRKTDVVIVGRSDTKPALLALVGGADGAG